MTAAPTTSTRCRHVSCRASAEAWCWDGYRWAVFCETHMRSGAQVSTGRWVVDWETPVSGPAPGVPRAELLEAKDEEPAAGNDADPEIPVVAVVTVYQCGWPRCSKGAVAGGTLCTTHGWRAERLGLDQAVRIPFDADERWTARQARRRQDADRAVAVVVNPSEVTDALTVEPADLPLAVTSVTERPAHSPQATVIPFVIHPTQQEPAVTAEPEPTPKLCRWPVCDRPARDRDLCGMHIQRLRKAGLLPAAGDGEPDIPALAAAWEARPVLQPAVRLAPGGLCGWPGCDKPPKGVYCDRDRYRLHTMFGTTSKLTPEQIASAPAAWAERERMRVPAAGAVAAAEPVAPAEPPKPACEACEQARAEREMAETLRDAARVELQGILDNDRTANKETQFLAELDDNMNPLPVLMQAARRIARLRRYSEDFKARLNEYERALADAGLPVTPSAIRGTMRGILAAQGQMSESDLRRRIRLLEESDRLRAEALSPVPA